MDCAMKLYPGVSRVSWKLSCINQQNAHQVFSSSMQRTSILSPPAGKLSEPPRVCLKTHSGYPALCPSRDHRFAYCVANAYDLVCFETLL